MQSFVRLGIYQDKSKYNTERKNIAKPFPKFRLHVKIFKSKKYEVDHLIWTPRNGNYVFHSAPTSEIFGSIGSNRIGTIF